MQKPCPRPTSATPFTYRAESRVTSLHQTSRRSICTSHRICYFCGVLRVVGHVTSIIHFTLPEHRHNEMHCKWISPSLPPFSLFLLALFYDSLATWPQNCNADTLTDPLLTLFRVINQLDKSSEKIFGNCFYLTFRVKFNLFLLQKFRCVVYFESFAM